MVSVPKYIYNDSYSNWILRNSKFFTRNFLFLARFWLESIELQGLAEGVYVKYT